MANPLPLFSRIPVNPTVKRDTLYDILDDVDTVGWF